AITAAQSGARVLLFERGRLPRHKVCGEFVSAESLDLARKLLVDLGRILTANCPSISQARIFIDGKVVQASINPPAASITRFELDAALWASCQVHGVQTLAETNVQRVDAKGPFAITAGDQIYEAKAVVNAGGRWSNFTSAATRARISESVAGKKWIGLKRHFQETSSPTSVDLYFFDGGYCGVQPIAIAGDGQAGRINACAMVSADIANSLSEVFSQHPELRIRSAAWLPASDQVTTSPLVFHPPEPLQNSMLQVGDAATFVDPFIGDGISLALRSGALAAESLITFFKNQCSLKEASDQYARNYRERFAPVFTASSRLRGLLRCPPAVRKPVLSVLARTPFLTNQIVRMTR